MCFGGEESENFEGEIRKEAKQYGLEIKGYDKDDIADSKQVHNGFDHPGLLVRTQEEPHTLQRMSWGLIPFYTEDTEQAKRKENNTLNARCETIFDLPSFRMPIMKRRCLIYFSAFYETQHRSKNEKVKYKISLRDKPVMTFAGVYDVWENPETGIAIKSCSIITCEANPLMAEIHNKRNRMPIILGEDVAMKWLDTDLTKEEISKLMVPFPEEKMQAVPMDPIHRDLFSMDSPISDF